MIIYHGTLKSFTFGRFDVGYLEDKDDPNSNTILPREKIETINTDALKLDSMPESDFYGHDVYGDIRFNPNDTCGGPVLLWRSHNTYNRTYEKTIIVRDVQDPTKNALAASANPTTLMQSSTSTSTTSSTTSTQTASSITQHQNQAQTDLQVWKANNNNNDGIPYGSRDIRGDVFQVSSSGNTTKVNVGLGKLDATLDTILKDEKTFIS